MNWYLLAFLILTAGGLLIVRKKMKVGKDDGEKLIAKIKKKKLSEFEKEFENNGVIIPCDKRDFEDFDKFKESVKDNKKTMDRLKTIDEDFVQFDYTFDEDDE